MLEVRVIVVMGKAPVPGRVKTRLAPLLGAGRAALLARVMAMDVVAAARATGLPVRIAADVPDDPFLRSLGVPVEPQATGDLGARLAHALRDGGVAIGTDSPTLPPRLLSSASRALETHDMVFAPAFDGGYVLVGAHPRAGSRGVFEGIPWSAADTFAVSIARAAALDLSVATLEFWYDVDEPADLTFLRAHLRSLPPSVAPHTRSLLQDLPDAAADR